MLVTLWIREDGQQPKAIEPEATPPGPGIVVRVQARSVADARETFRIAEMSEPQEDQDPQGWLAWRAAKRRVVLR